MVHEKENLISRIILIKVLRGEYLDQNNKQKSADINKCNSFFKGILQKVEIYERLESFYIKHNENMKQKTDFLK